MTEMVRTSWKSYNPSEKPGLQAGTRIIDSVWFSPLVAAQGGQKVYACKYQVCLSSILFLFPPPSRAHRAPYPVTDFKSFFFLLFSGLAPCHARRGAGRQCGFESSKHEIVANHELRCSFPFRDT